ncbi:survival of motor neuron-related-splicing factor 30-like [Artemia franciscana]|uniref:Tudor domain-containing protein n=1 Tax=Artemia franciscana TaxID=6661 RepID=A0AA88HE59_ARTSF|nr:hypothetical protein QYM36_017414 [Artemia franciscana]
MEELQSNLSTYKLQLEQVEAALTADENNQELLKLKQDLTEVIALTLELIKAQLDTEEVEEEVESEKLTKWLSDEGPVSALTPIKEWKVGDEASAPWSKDSQYYDVTITNILEYGEAEVKFVGYIQKETVPLVVLREPNGKRGREEDAEKKKKTAAQKEYLKARKLKKQARFQEMIDAREKEKSKWQSFATKASSKLKKGVTKRSIFATPEAADGRVGVGTCGIGGKPMTEYTLAEKRRKGMI